LAKNSDAAWLPKLITLYLARIEGLGRGDFVRIDYAAGHHAAL
jgi:hypothetical protein